MGASGVPSYLRLCSVYAVWDCFRNGMTASDASLQQYYKDFHDAN